MEFAGGVRTASWLEQGIPLQISQASKAASRAPRRIAITARTRCGHHQRATARRVLQFPDGSRLKVISLPKDAGNTIPFARRSVSNATAGPKMGQPATESSLLKTWVAAILTGTLYTNDERSPGASRPGLLDDKKEV